MGRSSNSGARVMSDVEPRPAVASTRYHARCSKSIQIGAYMFSHLVLERLLFFLLALVRTTNAAVGLVLWTTEIRVVGHALLFASPVFVVPVQPPKTEIRYAWSCSSPPCRTQLLPNNRCRTLSNVGLRYSALSDNPVFLQLRSSTEA